MDFSSIETLKAEGFKGFLPLKDFFNQGQIDKDGPGVYLVLRLKNAPPDFLEIGSGGKYDGRDPNDKLPKLKAKWLKGAIVLYIGQSGGENSGSTVGERVKLLAEFGQGCPVRHYGGRYLWQLADSQDFVICWKTDSNLDPKILKQQLFDDFKTEFGKLPFANLRR